jgi:hypothetical protein
MAVTTSRIHLDLFRIQQCASSATFERVLRWVEQARASGIAAVSDGPGLAWAATVTMPSEDDVVFALDYMRGFGVPGSCVRKVK